MSWKNIAVYATIGTVAVGSAVTFPKLRSADSYSYSEIWMSAKKIAVVPNIIVGSAIGIFAAVSRPKDILGGPTTDSEIKGSRLYYKPLHPATIGTASAGQIAMQSAKRMSISPTAEPGQSKNQPLPGIHFGKILGIGATLGTFIGGGFSIAIPKVIQTLGFGVTGIANSSIAAGIHSMLGNVTAGSIFASMQSAGAVGAISWTTISGLTIAGGTVGVVTVAATVQAYYWWNNQKDHEPGSKIPPES